MEVRCDGQRTKPGRSGPDRGRKPPPGAAQHVLVAVVQPVGDPVRPAAAAAVPHQLRFGAQRSGQHHQADLFLSDSAGSGRGPGLAAGLLSSGGRGRRESHQRHFFGHASLLPPHRYRVSAGHGGVCAAVPPVHQHSAVLRHCEPDRGVLRHPGHRELSGAGQIPLLYGSGRQKLCDHLHHHGHHGGGQPAAHAGAAVYPQHPVGAGDLLRAFGVPGAGAYGLYAQKLSVAQRARYPQSGGAGPARLGAGASAHEHRVQQHRHDPDLQPVRSGVGQCVHHLYAVFLQHRKAVLLDRQQHQLSAGAAVLCGAGKVQAAVPAVRCPLPFRGLCTVHDRGCVPDAHHRAVYVRCDRCRVP